MRPHDKQIMAVVKVFGFAAAILGTAIWLLVLLIRA